MTVNEVIVLPVARACDDQSTVHLNSLPVLRVCAMFESGCLQ